MECQIILLTPQIAKELLEKNVGNRKVKNVKNFYIAQMKDGMWKENGEAIIIDKDGYVKDGQHRLLAVVASGHSYHCPLVSGVDPDVMDTIDTGTNRSLSDVLQLNGFEYYSDVASLVKGIISYNSGLSPLTIGGSRIRTGKNYISNSVGLEYATKFRDKLSNLIKLSKTTYEKEIVKILSPREIGLFLYILSEYNITDEHVVFMNKICGINSDEDSATYWVHKKFLSAKINEEPMEPKWKLTAIVKAWNIFCDGDYPVNHMKVNPKVNQKVRKLAV